MPSSVQPPQAAQKPRIWLRVSGGVILTMVGHDGLAVRASANRGVATHRAFKTLKLRNFDFRIFDGPRAPAGPVTEGGDTLYMFLPGHTARMSEAREPSLGPASSSSGSVLTPDS